jgi:hypothetical protein
MKRTLENFFQFADSDVLFSERTQHKNAYNQEQYISIEHANSILKQYAEENWPVVYANADEPRAMEQARPWAPGKLPIHTHKARLAFIEEVESKEGTSEWVMEKAKENQGAN